MGVVYFIYIVRIKIEKNEGPGSGFSKDGEEVKEEIIVTVDDVTAVNNIYSENNNNNTHTNNNNNGSSSSGSSSSISNSHNINLSRSGSFSISRNISNVSISISSNGNECNTPHNTPHTAPHPITHNTAHATQHNTPHSTTHSSDTLQSLHQSLPHPPSPSHTQHLTAAWLWALNPLAINICTRGSVDSVTNCLVLGLLYLLLKKGKDDRIFVFVFIAVLPIIFMVLGRGRDERKRRI